MNTAVGQVLADLGFAVDPLDGGGGHLVRAAR
jgi:hypothetical protein